MVDGHCLSIVGPSSLVVVASTVDPRSLTVRTTYLSMFSLSFIEDVNKCRYVPTQPTNVHAVYRICQSDVLGVPISIDTFSANRSAWNIILIADASLAKVSRLPHCIDRSSISVCTVFMYWCQQYPPWYSRQTYCGGRYASMGSRPICCQQSVPIFQCCTY